MSQTNHGDLEGGNSDGHLNQHQSTPNQSLQSSLDESDIEYEEPIFRDSSWPLYSMYSNIAEDEITKMVERCQRETDGTLVFSGLFSATIGALLTVSIPDLKPNSQDTSAFYLKNIYQLSGNSSNSHVSTLSGLAEPPAFSPPKYAIWVNSLWVLSLALSLSCAMQATLNRSWVVHYFEITRMAWFTPVKRARIRAFFANGNPGPYTLWGTHHFESFLHFSVLLFVTGGLIYLFNINQGVFYAVVWWVGVMAVPYTYSTVEVFFKSPNVSYTPFTQLALSIHLGISYVVFQVCSYIPFFHGLRDSTRRRYYDLNNCYGEGILRGKQKTADEIASKPSSEIDDLILQRILLTLDEDHKLESFFDAIPGFCNSKLTVMPLPFLVQTKLRPALDGFLDRTFSSRLVSESVRASRLITCLNAAHAAFGRGVVSQILYDTVDGRWIEALQSVEIGHALILWSHKGDHDVNVRRIAACIIARARRRDDRWTMLVKETFDLPDGVLQDSLAHGDSVLLSILIHISHQSNNSGFWMSGILSSLSKFDVCNTLPELQDDFRTLCNEIAQEARNQGLSSIPAQILREIGHLYISLNQGTNAVPTAVSASTDSLDSILDQLLLHPFNGISGHQHSSAIYTPTGSLSVPSLTQPDRSPAASPSNSSPIESDHTPDGTASQQVEEAKVITEPPSSTDYTPHPSHTQGSTFPHLAINSVHITQATSIVSPPAPESIRTATTWDPDLLVPDEASDYPRQSAPSAPAEIAAANFVQSNDATPQIHSSESGDISQTPVAPPLIFQHPDLVSATITPSTGPDPAGDPDALQDTISSATLSHLLEGNKQHNTVAPCAAPDISELPSTVNPQTLPTVSSTIVVSDSSPILLPVRSSGITIAEPLTCRVRSDPA